MKKLIVTADDYGMSSAVNRAIDAGAKIGLITSTNVMTNMDYYCEAVKLKELENFCHLRSHFFRQAVPKAYLYCGKRFRGRGYSSDGSPESVPSACLFSDGRDCGVSCQQQKFPPSATSVYSAAQFLLHSRAKVSLQSKMQSEKF